MTTALSAAVLCGGVLDADGDGLPIAEEGFDATADVGTATVLKTDREGCTTVDEETEGVV